MAVRVTLAIVLVFLLCSCSDGEPQQALAAQQALSLPAPSALLKQLPKAAKVAESDLARNGSQFEVLLPNQRVSIQGSAVQLAPQFFPPATTAFADLACAMYRFDLAGYDRDNTLRAVWQNAPQANSAWIGMADMAADRWEWHPCPADGIVSFTDPAQYTAPDGEALVAIVMTGLVSGTLQRIRFGAEPPLTNHELWFYIGTNLQVQANLDNAIELVNRAADVGYTTCVLADSKLDRLSDPNLDGIYWPKLQQFDAACEARGMRLVPALCSLGWAESLLYFDPNLIEGQEFKDVEFSVNLGTADSIQDAVINNGGFEFYSGDDFDSWNQMDGAGLSTFVDTTTVRSGAASIRYENFPKGQYGPNDRVTQAISVLPWHHYVIRFWIKTDAVVPVGSLWCRVFNEDFSRMLTFLEPTLPATGDWREVQIAFNSQDNNQVTMYLGIWGGVSGRFWVDDVDIVNAGLVNLIRRPGAPFTVKNADGDITYTEGVDYDYAEDPNLGNNPWPGAYDIYHARPLLSIPPGSPIQDGDTLLVSGYHAVQTNEGKAACCLTEDGIYDIIESNFIKLKELVDPEMIVVAVDEHRVANWCAGCQAQGTTPAGLIADACNRIDQIAQDKLPGCGIVTWNDMFDPDHNAVPNYYLCNGSFENTFAGNPPPSWDIGNWRFFDYNGNTPDTSIQYFHNRGHRQILAGYYDRGNSDDIGPWLDYTGGLSSVYACMYTTWASDYSELEAWAQAVKDWDAANL